MEELTYNESANLRVDTEMCEVYNSWFTVNMDQEISDNLRQMIFLHFRLAFTAGRTRGQQDAIARIQEHVDFIIG